MYETINPNNVVMYAIRHYNNPQCEGEKEFEDDLKRFKYIKRLLRKHYDTGILKERLNSTKTYEIKATPTIYFNEEKYEGDLTFEALKLKIDSLLN